MLSKQENIDCNEKRDVSRDLPQGRPNPKYFFASLYKICRVMFTEDNALKTWFTIILFVDAFSILMKFFFLIGNFFKKRFIDIISI